MQGIDLSINITSLTPLHVVERFIHSDDPGLREVAEDLAKTHGINTKHLMREPYPQIVPPATDLSAVIPYINQIIDPRGRWIYGHTSIIAKCIFGDETLTGGNYNRHIQQIKRQIREFYDQLTTTTPTPPTSPPAPAIARAA